MDHDSLVTVRLSEPPVLHVNTTLPPKTGQVSKSPYGNEYTPVDAMAEVVQEEEDNNSETVQTPTSASEHGKTLQDELGGDQEEEDEQAEEDETAIAELRNSSDSEVVNWDQLQKTEDQESKEQDSDNVSSIQAVRPCTPFRALSLVIRC